MLKYSLTLHKYLITKHPLHQKIPLKEPRGQVWLLIIAGKVGDSFLKHDTHVN